MTIVGISHAAVECMRARASLEEVGIAAEVIDPVWLSPLDIETIADSVARDRPLLVVDTAWTFCGASAEIIAAVGERLGGMAGFRFKRMGFAPGGLPDRQALEDLFYPNGAEHRRRGRALVGGPDRCWSPDHVETSEVMEFKGPF